MHWIVIASAFITPLIPLWWEVQGNDKKGDKHPNRDWERRLFLCVVAGAISTAIELWTLNWYWRWWFTVFELTRFTTATALVFAVVFPYWMNYVHLREGVTTHIKRIPYQLLTDEQVLLHVATHMSDSAWPDRTRWWRDLGWCGRAAVNVMLMCLTYFILTGI